MSPQFWQLFLSAELPYEKSREFLANLGNFHDPISALRSWSYLTTIEQDRINRSNSAALESALKNGVSVLEEHEFPESLANCPVPPPALFTWGDPAALNAPKVAVVGTRRATTYGKAAAQKFAESLAAAGITVVSGGAFGIDTAAHKGALEGRGKTVAVLGTGVETAYPSTNKALYEEIRATGGCLISQFPVGQPSYPANFLARNQIIAALCDALLVIEAPLKSGSLSTATAATDLNKPIFVVPGNIVLENYKGSHQLIREGATLVDHPDQILEALSLEMSLSRVPAPAPDLTPIQSDILGALTEIPQTPESILSIVKIGPSDLLAELTLLELEGLILKESSGYARKP